MCSKRSSLFAVITVLIVLFCASCIQAAPLEIVSYKEGCKESKINNGLKCAREFDRLWKNEKTIHCPLQIIICMMRFHIQDYDTLKGRVDFMRK
uniref:Uncharacterized protein n=1 Tax=Magallana gigas TaxID=29159 RepID=K1PU27_MAGGI